MLTFPSCMPGVVRSVYVESNLFIETERRIQLSFNFTHDRYTHFSLQLKLLYRRRRQEMNQNRDRTRQ